MASLEECCQCELCLVASKSKDQYFLLLVTVSWNDLVYWVVVNQSWVGKTPEAASTSNHFLPQCVAECHKSGGRNWRQQVQEQMMIISGGRETETGGVDETDFSGTSLSCASLDYFPLVSPHWRTIGIHCSGLCWSSIAITGNKLLLCATLPWHCPTAAPLLLQVWQVRRWAVAGEGLLHSEGTTTL